MLCNIVLHALVGGTGSGSILSLTNLATRGIARDGKVLCVVLNVSDLAVFHSVVNLVDFPDAMAHVSVLD